MNLRMAAARAVMVGLLAVSGAVASSAASASNGFFLPGYGSRSLGLGGGGTALPEDALTVVNNVAGLMAIDDRTDLGATLYTPWTEIEIGDQRGSTELHYFLAPSFGMRRAIGDTAAWGFAIYGNGGIGNRYHPSPIDQVVGGGEETGLEDTDDLSLRMVSLLIVPSFAWQATPEHAFGVGLLVAYQRLNAKGLRHFACLTPEGAADPGCPPGPPGERVGDLTNEGWDDQVGGGLRLGWLWTVNPQLSIGAGASTKIISTRFKAYENLLPDGGRFELPAMVNLGLAWHATRTLTMVFDFQRVYYESSAAFGNKGPAVGVPPQPDQLLGNDRGYGFGWRDQNIYKLGFRYAPPDARWIWRFGMNYGQSPLRRSELAFGLLNPAVTELSAHIGFSYRLRNGDEITMAFFHGFRETPAGMTVLGPAELDHEEFALDFTYTWR